MCVCVEMGRLFYYYYTYTYHPFNYIRTHKDARYTPLGVCRRNFVIRKLLSNEWTRTMCRRRRVWTAELI